MTARGVTVAAVILLTIALGACTFGCTQIGVLRFTHHAAPDVGSPELVTAQADALTQARATMARVTARYPAATVSTEGVQRACFGPRRKWLFPDSYDHTCKTRLTILSVLPGSTDPGSTDLAALVRTAHQGIIGSGTWHSYDEPRANGTWWEAHYEHGLVTMDVTIGPNTAQLRAVDLALQEITKYERFDARRPYWKAGTPVPAPVVAPPSLLLTVSGQIGWYSN